MLVRWHMLSVAIACMTVHEDGVHAQHMLTHIKWMLHTTMAEGAAQYWMFMCVVCKLRPLWFTSFVFVLTNVFPKYVRCAIQTVMPLRLQHGTLQ